MQESIVFMRTGLEWSILRLMFHTRATPNKPAAPALKNTSPTYSEGIQGWDLWWLELLELLVAGG